jgi:cytochrome P450
MTTTARVRFNPFGPEFRRDPYPLYRQLRDARPVHRTLGMWVLTRYADVQAVLRDRTFSAGLIPQLMSVQAERVSGVDVSRIERLGRTSLVFTDNPDHARLRGLVNRVVSAQTVAALRPMIERVADRLIDGAYRNGRMDVVADLAAPLPVTSLCEWMAVPADVREHVGSWTHDIRFLLEPGLMQGDDFRHVCQVLETFVSALEEVIAARGRHPGDDLISRLLAAETGSGDRLTHEEIAFVCIMCFVAGNETTKSLVSNGVHALLSHPDQAALLRARPQLVTSAVREALRYDSPLQLTKRLATADVDVGGTRISAGDQVLLCLGAANRDPDAFDRPDEFDITRDATGHLAFGYGMHGCLGGTLATLQAEVAFDRLVRRTAGVELAVEPAGDLQWQDHSFIVRGLGSLPVILRTPI